MLPIYVLYMSQQGLLIRLKIRITNGFLIPRDTDDKSFAIMTKRLIYPCQDKAPSVTKAMANTIWNGRVVFPFFILLLVPFFCLFSFPYPLFSFFTSSFLYLLSHPYLFVKLPWLSRQSERLLTVRSLVRSQAEASFCLFSFILTLPFFFLFSQFPL